MQAMCKRGSNNFKGKKTVSVYQQKKQTHEHL